MLKELQCIFGISTPLVAIVKQGTLPLINLLPLPHVADRGLGYQSCYQRWRSFHYCQSTH